MLHLFAANPASASRTERKAVSIVFFDGDCALCNAFVRFAMPRDHDANLNFAPLGGQTIQEKVSAKDRAALPDSICVLTPEGSLLVRSRAVAHVLDRLGGFWRVCGVLVSWTPRTLADAFYDFVAANRRRLGQPTDACPTPDPSLRARLLP
jgi:predicted DCC family thiol-disulfide oxidoreductase YuxK